MKFRVSVWTITHLSSSDRKGVLYCHDLVITVSVSDHLEPVLGQLREQLDQEVNSGALSGSSACVLLTSSWGSLEKILR